MTIPIAPLTERLNELADAFNARQMTAGAMRVWRDALAECTWNDVQNALCDWPKSNTRMPAPADILKLCRNRISDRIEGKAAEHAAESRKPWTVTSLPANSEVARTELAKIRALLGMREQPLKGCTQ